jgi:hypothetical protein
VVDRFEGEVAVVETEDGQTWDLPRWLLPPAAAPGDVVVAAPEVPGLLRVDAEETLRRRERAERALARLRGRDPGGHQI